MEKRELKNDIVFTKEHLKGFDLPKKLKGVKNALSTSLKSSLFLWGIMLSAAHLLWTKGEVEDLQWSRLCA